MKQTEPALPGGFCILASFLQQKNAPAGASFPITFLLYNIQSLITLWSLNSFPTTVLSIFLSRGFLSSSSGRGSFISSGDFPSISFTVLSNRSLTSYTLPPDLRNTTVYTAKSVYSFHCSTYRILRSENRISWCFSKLA